MTLDPDKSTPPYRQIADALRRAVRTGKYAPGARIPTIDALAAHFGVARNTVRSALRELSDEGLVVSRHGSGVFVRSSLPEPTAADTDKFSLDAVVQELAEVRKEVRTLRQRMAHLESLIQERPSRDA